MQDLSYKSFLSLNLEGLPHNNQVHFSFQMSKPMLSKMSKNKKNFIQKIR